MGYPVEQQKYQSLANLHLFFENQKEETGKKAQSRTKRYAPVDTGHLKSQVSLDFLDNGLTARVESKAMKKGYNYAYLQEFGGLTRQFRFTPHVRPMFYETKPEFIADMEKIIKKWGG